MVMANKKTYKILQGEKWATIPGHKTAYGEKYAISNFGRLVKFSKHPKDGSLLKGSLQEGYPIWRTRKNGEYCHALLHRLVAKFFLPKHLRNETIVIHINYKKTDNHYYNLQWATPEKASAHQQGSPAVKRAKKKMRENIGSGYTTKLTEAQVRKIRTLLAAGKTLKEIALKYGVSDMQIHRIKTRENWGYLKG